MSNIDTAIHGIYPRSEKLAQTTRDVGRKRATVAFLKKLQREETDNLIATQQKLGFTYIEDGKLTWQDIFRPIIAATEGLEEGALTRWFDNNTFFRQPVITQKTLRLNAKKMAQNIPVITPKRAWKVTLPSPFTFAKLARYDDMSFEEALKKITKLLIAISQEAEKRGVSFIQYNEPYLAYTRPTQYDLRLFKSTLKELRYSKNVHIAIHFFFGDAAPILRAIADAPIDAIGVDFFKTELESLPQLKSTLVAGVIDGRNSLLENESELKKFIAKILKKQKQGKILLTNNSDLELLPETVAAKKLQILSSVAKEFGT